MDKIAIEKAIKISVVVSDEMTNIEAESENKESITSSF